MARRRGQTRGQKLTRMYTIRILFFHISKLTSSNFSTIFSGIFSFSAPVRSLQAVVAECPSIDLGFPPVREGGKGIAKHNIMGEKYIWRVCYNLFFYHLFPGRYIFLNFI